MKVNMKCLAGLSRLYECDYRDASEIKLPEASSVNDAVRSLGIGDDEVKVVFVNGRLTDRNKPLSDGDQVTLVPATGGM